MTDTTVSLSARLDLDQCSQQIEAAVRHEATCTCECHQLELVDYSGVGDFALLRPATVQP